MKLIRGVTFPGAEGMYDLLLRDGKIERIAPYLEADAECIDAYGLVAAPGLFDLHVHLRDPGYPEKEDVLSGCAAAAAGGVTGLVPMPNTKPVTDSAERISSLLQKAEHASCEVYPCCAMTLLQAGKEAADFKKAKKAGAVAVSDDGVAVQDDLLMEKILREAHKNGLLPLCHSEDQSKTGREREIYGVLRDIALSEKTGCPVHLCHVSCKESIAAIRSAKLRGVPVTSETAPHYFAFTEEMLRLRDADYKMNPPLRTEWDRLSVIAGLADGTIDVIATDHAPHTPEEKADYSSAPCGVIGMETSFSASYTYLVKPGYLTLSALLDKMSGAPRRILSLPPVSFALGSRADFFLFRPGESFRVDPEKLHGKSKNAVFKGTTLFGTIKMTVCRGEIVYGSADL